MMTTLDMKSNDLEPDLVLVPEDADGIADLNGVVSWRIIGKFRGQIIVDAAPDTIVVDPTNHSKATLTRAWQAGETDVIGEALFEAEALWPGNRAQTFPAVGYVKVRFVQDLG